MIPIPAWLARLSRFAQAALLPLSLVACVVVFVVATRPVYPIGEWLFWRYAKAWGWCALFSLACASFGHLAMRRIFGARLPLRELAVFSYAVGVLAFFLFVFLFGLAGLLYPALGVALPLAMVAAGAPDAIRLVRRTRRHLAAARARAKAARPLWYWPAILFGLAGIAMLYFAILAPRNIAFDAYMYHLGIAQEYATTHAIRGAQEAWLPAVLPHLASVLYTWCFILPGQAMFDRIECAQHLEFVLFLYTLASMPVMVRWLVPGARASASWVTMFLFPGILLYDSSLHAVADHVAALWAIPAYLALRRAWKDLAYGPLLAAMMAGALLTKYQSVYLAAPVGLAFFGRLLWLLLRPSAYELVGRPVPSGPRPIDVMAALGTAGMVGVLLTAPHWLKNWVFYGDPLFPYLHRYFPPKRWVPDTGSLFDDWAAFDSKDWAVHGTTFEKLKKTAAALATFSFAPHDWPKFHGKWPVFGSLFSLSMLYLPFLRHARRTWGVALAAHAGVFIWFWTKHQDRYLQVIVPWMAVVVAASIALAWRASPTARWVVAALVGIQAIWGGDVYFIPAHAMTQASPAKTTTELLGQGYKKQWDERLEMTGSVFQMGRSKDLPADARVLIHGANARFGVWRPVINDNAGWQYGLRYELFDSPAALHDKLRALGVTHIAAHAEKSDSKDGLGADLRFFDYVEQDAVLVKAFGEYTLYRLPDAPPARAPGENLVLYLGCGKFYQPGLHTMDELSVRETEVQHPPPKKKPIEKASDVETATKLLQQADYAVTDASCKGAIKPAGLDRFLKVAGRRGEELWARKAAR